MSSPLHIQSIRLCLVEEGSGSIHILGWVWHEGECEHVLRRADGVGMWFFNDAWQEAIVEVALFGTSHT